MTPQVLTVAQLSTRLMVGPRTAPREPWSTELKEIPVYVRLGSDVFEVVGLERYSDALVLTLGAQS